MKRCASMPIRALASLVALTLGALALTTSAHAQNRVFPEPALRGKIVVTKPPEILLNGKPDRLAPGARLRNMNNAIVTPNSVLGQELLVNYTREAAGMVHEVWVLTPTEAAQRRAGLPDSVNVRMGADGSIQISN